MKSQTPTVLVAEDEKFLMDLYVTALKSAGFNVIPTYNGKEALDQMEKRKDLVDLVLLDIVMPEMDGFDTLEKIGKNPDLKKIPVIVFTNLNNEKDKKQALDKGAKEYLVKSEKTPSEIVETIRNFCLRK